MLGGYRLCVTAATARMTASMPDPGATLYFDTVSICNFFLADRLDLIERRYRKRTVITSEVMDEIAEGVAQGYAQLQSVARMVETGSFEISVPTAEDRKLYTALLQNLGPGDASVIACAKHRGGVAVTDDRVARSYCKEHGVRYTGTIGILKACCLSSMITSDEADDLLAAMIRHGFYSPVRRISGIL